MNRCLKRRSPGSSSLGESFARILTETTQSLVCVYDREGRILLFNEACERATGFSRDEVLGRDARDFVIPPEEREAFGEFLAYVWTAGTPSPQVGHWMTKDGGRRLIAWSNRPMAGADGEPATLVTTGHRPDRPRAARTTRTSARCEGDPSAKLAEVGRLATEQRALRRVATLVASEVSAGARVHGRLGGVRAGARGQRVGRRCATRATARRRSSAATTATASTSSSSASASRPTTTPRSAACAATRRAGAGRRLGRAGGQIAEAMFRAGYRSTAAAPIVVARRAVGRGRDRQRGPAARRTTENRLGAFCELVVARASPARRRARTSSPRAPGSSRPATSSAGGWSATSTTARSSASCRWR